MYWFGVRFFFDQSVPYKSAFHLLAIRRTALGVSMSDGTIRPVTQPEDDSSLLARIKGKDQQAMARFFELHSRLVYSVALRVLRDPAQAEDVMQETFIQVWTRPIAFDAARGSIASLLAVMTRNRSVDVLRRRKPSDSIDGMQIAAPKNLAHEIEHRILLDRVREVVRELPLEQQTALSLAFFDGLTHSEIAAQTSQPLGTIKTRIRAALQRLERTLAA